MFPHGTEGLNGKASCVEQLGFRRGEPGCNDSQVQPGVAQVQQPLK